MDNCILFGSTGLWYLAVALYSIYQHAFWKLSFLDFCMYHKLNVPLSMEKMPKVRLRHADKVLHGLFGHNSMNVLSSNEASSPLSLVNEITSCGMLQPNQRNIQVKANKANQPCLASFLVLHVDSFTHFPSLQINHLNISIGPGEER